MKVLLAGEGPNELGGWARHPSYRNTEEPGAIEALLRKVRAEGWRVVDGVLWKQIRKYQVGNRRGAEERNVLGLVLKAKEVGCDLVAFVRDRDGTQANPNRERYQAIEDGIRAAQEKIEECPRVIGGVAVKKLESWLMALLGNRNSEIHPSPERVLEDRGVAIKSTRDYVAVVRDADLDQVPADAESLRCWIERATAALDAGSRSV